MMLKREKGQGVLEYVILLTVVIAAILAFLSGDFSKTDGSKGLSLIMKKSADKMVTDSKAFSDIAK